MIGEYGRVPSHAMVPLASDLLRCITSAAADPHTVLPGGQ